MDRDRMLNHLRQQGEDEIAAMWEKTTALIAEEKAAVERQLALEQQRVDEEYRRHADLYTQTTILEAKRKAGAMRAAARDQFVQKLWKRARSLLPQLIEHESNLLGRLANELPKLTWARVMVSPRDRAAARGIFPQATVEENEQITGGFVVETADGQIRIMNTLAKRLEKAWPDILSQLMKEIMQLPEKDR